MCVFCAALMTVLYKTGIRLSYTYHKTILIVRENVNIMRAYLTRGTINVVYNVDNI